VAEFYVRTNVDPSWLTVKYINAQIGKVSTYMLLGYNVIFCPSFLEWSI